MTRQSLLRGGLWLICLGVACQAAPVATVVPTVAPTFPSPTNTASAHQFLHLATGESEPFSGATLPDLGLASEVVKLAFERAGYQVELTFLPWARGYNDALAQAYFGTFPYGKTPEREKEFYYSAPLYTLNGAFFARADTPIQFSGIENLTGVRACVPVGYSLFLIQRQIAAGTIQLDRPADLTACFKMLDAGRTDVIGTLEDMGWAVVDQEFGTRAGFKVLGRLEANHYLIVSRANPTGEQILQDFNQALAQLQAEGVIQQLVLKHLQ